MAQWDVQEYTVCARPMCGLQGVLEKELGDLVATKGRFNPCCEVSSAVSLLFKWSAGGYCYVLFSMCGIDDGLDLGAENRGIGGKEEEVKRICKKRMMRCGRDEINT